mmetsp:Transcript_26774/g.90125  ORF Transcript_26774/g.90125 Transcript_26774/m.90125 type:complete len:280 (-) Transcript_26774:123-962(-)
MSLCFASIMPCAMRVMYVGHLVVFGTNVASSSKSSSRRSRCACRASLRFRSSRRSLSKYVPGSDAIRSRDSWFARACATIVGLNECFDRSSRSARSIKSRRAVSRRSASPVDISATLRAGRARVYRLGADSSLSSHRGVVAFAVVVGTDLWPGVGGVGAKKAMLFLRRCAAQGVDALDMLRQWRDARPAAATLATDDAATRRVVDAVLAHCKAHAFPLEALLRTYLQPPTEELLLAPQIAWRWPSLRALRFVNALTVVAGHRKHTSCAFVTDHVMPLLT